MQELEGVDMHFCDTEHLWPNLGGTSVLGGPGCRQEDLNGSFFRVNEWWSPSTKRKDLNGLAGGTFVASAFFLGSVRYFVQEESPIWAQVASEAFRDSTFGMIDVRILESGRRQFFDKAGSYVFFFFSGV